MLFKFSSIGLMIQEWTGSVSPTGDSFMHDLLIALAFIGMVVAPAIVSAKSGAIAADKMDD